MSSDFFSPLNFNDATCVIPPGMDAPEVEPAPLHFTYSFRPTSCQAPMPTNGDQMTTILSESTSAKRHNK